MNAENVGYRFTDDEIATLALILSLNAPPGAAQYVIDQDAYDRAFEALTAAQVVNPAGEQVYIEPLTAMLLSEISDSPRCLRIVSGNRSVTIYSSLRLLVADEHFSGIHTLVPLRDKSEAAAYIDDTLIRRPLPADIALITDTGTGDRSEIAADAAALLRTSTLYLSEL